MAKSKPADLSGVYKESDTDSESDSETKHVYIVNQQTAADDLAYLAEKLGLDINQLRQERLTQKRQESQKSAQEHAERKKRNQELREAALLKMFFERQNKTVFVFVNGQQMNIKNFEDVKCPSCSHQIGMAIRGRVLDLLGTHPYITINPLMPIHGLVAIKDQIYCTAPTPDKRHTHTLRIQRVEPDCEP